MNNLFLIPLLPLIGSMIGFILHKRARLVVVFTSTLVIAAFFCVILFSFLYSKPLLWELKIIYTPVFAITLGLMFDHLTMVMLLLITFMSAIIHLFSRRYLFSDEAQGRFMAQLSFATFAVMILVMSNNLLTAFLGWQWIGLSLYLLLNHYHYDLKANKAAKKKFIINRLGDVTFLLAVILAYQTFHSSNYTTLFSAKDVVLVYTFSAKTIILCLVFIAIMTKSAQFPFHIWLPDTLETPTPVSAFMHAGIINAGGFLLARLSPIVTNGSFMMIVIFTIGVITMIFGSFFMLTQTNVKKQLAYSTVGQMGYMTLQCGLGCFSAAVFHLITHGFFKAALFLNSGNALALGSNSQASNNTSKFKKFILMLGMTLIIISIGLVFLFKLYGRIPINSMILAFMSLTLAQTIWEVQNNQNTVKSLITILVLLTGVFLFYLFFIESFSILLETSVKDLKTPVLVWQYSIVGLIVALQIFIWMILPQRLLKTKFMRRLYILSLNKGYIETFYRRYLLNPFRRLGDFGNYLLKNKAGGLFIFCLFTFLLMAAILGILDWHYQQSVVNIYLVILNLILFIFFLTIANRTESLLRLFVFTCMFELAFINIGLFINDPLASAAAIFHLINIALLILPLLLMIFQHQQAINQHLVEKNVLPWFSIYLSIVLLLLIGIPGTASFVSEFFILYALLANHVLLAIALAIGIVLLAIVVLHLLQLYIFNPAKLQRQNIKLPAYVHIICIICILFNVANGIYPAGLFNILQTIRVA